MITLTDTQLVILSQAALREDAGVILPERLRGNVARTTVSRLIARGLIEEVRAQGSLPVWRRDDEGALALRITSAGLAVIGVEPEHKEPSPEPETDGGGLGDEAAPAVRPLPRTGQPRAGTKQALVASLLSRPEGARSKS